MITASRQMTMDVKRMIRELAGSHYLYFDELLKVKASPHKEVNIWGACLSPATDLKDAIIYVMDSNQEWYEVTANNESAALVIASLYQRLTQLSKRHNPQQVPQVSTTEVDGNGEFVYNILNGDFL